MLTFSLYFLPAMHSGAIQYGDPTIASCESDLDAQVLLMIRDVHGNGIFTVGMGIPWESHGNGNNTPTWEWEWKGVGINKYGNGNDPIPIGKYSPRFFYCCRLALG